MIRLLIADDHPLIRNGIKLVIEQSDDIQLLVEATNGKELLDLLSEFTADVVLLDINMPTLNGIDTCFKARKEFKDLKILVFSQYDEKRFVKRVMKCGASGYLLKNAALEEVLTAIRMVYNGAIYLSEGLPNIFDTQQKPKENDRLFPDISKREMDVLRLICDESNTQEIADELFISPHTVETHRANLLLKVGAKNTAGLVKWAIENEVLPDLQENR